MKHDQRRKTVSFNFRILAATLVVGLALICSCRHSDSNQAGARRPGGNESSSARTIADPPIFQPQGSGQVQIQIENPHRLQLSLFRVLGNELRPMKDLEANSASQSLEVESGFYSLQTDQSSIGIPVPALAPFLANKNLHLAIEPRPANEIHWCWIPAGPAIVGDTLGVGREDERPARIEEVAGFWMAEKEVTNRQYAEFLSDHKQINRKWIDLGSRKCLIQKIESGKYASKSNVAQAEQMPVVMVSLEGALAYCKWLASKTSQSIRLPTEIEWEKAARGPESFVYAYGNIYKQSQANQESGKLKPVGTYKPNSFGLYDMTGNVFEWMSDKADPTKTETTLNHSLRGGSFVLDGMYLRNSFRMRQSPTVMTDDIGFRIVRSPLPLSTEKKK